MASLGFAYLCIVGHFLYGILPYLVVYLQLEPLRSDYDDVRRCATSPDWCAYLLANETTLEYDCRSTYNRWPSTHDRAAAFYTGCDATWDRLWELRRLTLALLIVQCIVGTVLTVRSAWVKKFRSNETFQYTLWCNLCHLVWIPFCLTMAEEAPCSQVRLLVPLRTAALFSVFVVAPPGINLCIRGCTRSLVWNLAALIVYMYMAIVMLQQQTKAWIDATPGQCTPSASIL